MTSLVLLGTINWGVIGWVTLGTIVFIVLVAAIGRGIAAAFPPKPEHMSSFKKPAAATTKTTAPKPAAAPVVASRGEEIPPEIIAVISASIAVALRGQKYSVCGISENGTEHPNIERIMAEWSMEGRRQVYSSHQLR